MTKRRLLIGVLATLAILGPLAYLWQQSRMPGTYNVMDMGYVDYGGGPSVGHHASETSVDELRLQDPREGDVTFTLTARQERFTLASGREVDGFTLNGTSPGPSIVAHVLRGAGVPGGVHGDRGRERQPGAGDDGERDEARATGLGRRHGVLLSVFSSRAMKHREVNGHGAILRWSCASARAHFGGVAPSKERPVTQVRVRAKASHSARAIDVRVWLTW